MDDVKITVIIPTRERCDVLGKALETVTDQDYGNLEIIVSDNFGSDGTQDTVRSSGDARVKYINTGRRLSMSHNWEFALSHVTEGWVTIIGDDDGLLPGSVQKIASIIRSSGVSAIRSRVCSYCWPSAINKDFGRLGVPLQSGEEIRDSRTWLSKVLSGRAAYPELPMLYNGGYVDFSVLKEIRSRTGSFYRSCIPDVYSAVSIASVIDRYLFCNEPLAINGASRHSTGTSQFNGKGGSDSSPEKKFRAEGNIPFHPDVPVCADGSYPPSLQAMVYESYLQSMDLRGGGIAPDSHSRQLEVIMATAGRHQEAIQQWGQTFAAQHDLDFTDIRSKAAVSRLFLPQDSLITRMASALGTYSVGSPELPIRDVREAAVAAGEIVRAMPGRLENLWRRAGQAVQKIRQAQ